MTAMSRSPTAAVDGIATVTEVFAAPFECAPSATNATATAAYDGKVTSQPSESGLNW